MLQSFCKLFIRIKYFNERRNGGKLLEKQQQTNVTTKTNESKWIERKEQFDFLLLLLKE